MNKKLHIDDPDFPQITYRRGGSGRPTPTLRGTAIRVQTIVVANRDWGLSPEQIAAEYDLSQAQVKETLGFYQSHRQEIDIDLEIEQSLERSNVSS